MCHQLTLDDVDSSSIVLGQKLSRHGEEATSDDTLVVTVSTLPGGYGNRVVCKV
jgi:hypothetical protein